MDDKFLRDKINDDNIEIPESLLPENISKLLEKSEEKVNGLCCELAVFRSPTFRSQ